MVMFYTLGIQEACSTGGETKSYSTLLGSALSHRSYFLCRADKNKYKCYVHANYSGLWPNLLSTRSTGSKQKFVASVP